MQTAYIGDFVKAGIKKSMDDKKIPDAEKFYYMYQQLIEENLIVIENKVKKSDVAFKRLVNSYEQFLMYANNIAGGDNSKIVQSELLIEIKEQYVNSILFYLIYLRFKNSNLKIF